MSKRQSYTLVFNQDQIDATSAMFLAGGQLSEDVRDLVNAKILNGDVTDDSTPTLSEDGLTLISSANLGPAPCANCYKKRCQWLSCSGSAKWRLDRLIARSVKPAWIKRWQLKLS